MGSPAPPKTMRKSICMKLQINGDDREFSSPLTLTGLVEQLGMKQDRVAVELNRDIVPRDKWPAGWPTLLVCAFSRPHSKNGCPTLSWFWKGWDIQLSIS